MTKQEFLDGLRMALASRVNASQVEENIRYYEDYINTQVRMNRSEADVIAELGDPRLLARSISDANKRAERGGADGGESYDSQGGYGDYTGYANGNGMRRKKHLFHMPLWLVLFLVFAVLILILGAAFSILSYLMPVLLPALLIVLVVRWIRST